MVDGPVVAVRGEAYREVPPELARFAVTATARDRDREATLTRLAERAAAVRVLLDEHADRRWSAGRPASSGCGRRRSAPASGWSAYHGSVTTTVTVTDFTALGELMLRLADQDQVEVAGPWWSLRPDSPAHREARQAAIARRAAPGPGVRRGARCPGDRAAGAGRHRAGADQPMMCPGRRRRRTGRRPPELELDPQPQTVQAAVRARFTISEPVLG